MMKIPHLKGYLEIIQYGYVMLLSVHELSKYLGVPDYPFFDEVIRICEFALLCLLLRDDKGDSVEVFLDLFGVFVVSDDHEAEFDPLYLVVLCVAVGCLVGLLIDLILYILPAWGGFSHREGVERFRSPDGDSIQFDCIHAFMILEDGVAIL